MYAYTFEAESTGHGKYFGHCHIYDVKNNEVIERNEENTHEHNTNAIINYEITDDSVLLTEEGGLESELKFTEDNDVLIRNTNGKEERYHHFSSVPDYDELQALVSSQNNQSDKKEKSKEDILNSGIWVKYSPQAPMFETYAFSDGIIEHKEYMFDNGSVREYNSGNTRSFMTYTVDDNGNITSEKLYNDWKNWLGTWNSASGQPDYLLNKATADPKLVISDQEMEGLYAAIGTAFVSGSDMNEEYCSYPDLLLEKDSEVTFTLLGGSTCWNSTLGYYYYTDDNKPTTPTDINPIMLFPNTQDGQWARADILQLQSYNGNIGTLRGDVVQLMYYPNIANNDKSGATKVFPKGTRIGFILKTQGWGMQGSSYSLRANKLANKGFKQYNCWCTTTDGLSYGRKLKDDQGKYPNIEGQSRGAKFSYKASNGDTYTLISFEDAMDDLDFDDLIFALKPVGVFASLPGIANKKSSTNGVYAFEDKWPSKGDYDLNDAVIDVKHEKEFNDKGKIIKETFYLTTYQNYVELKSGLGLTLNKQANPKNIEMKKVAPESTDTLSTVFTNSGGVYYLTEDIKAELGTTYILELEYKNPLSSSSVMASIQPFIYRSEGNQNWEVHIPMEAPTAKMKTSYFGKGDDRSNPDKGLYFVRQGNYPFAFYLEGADISAFEETILKRENESKAIDKLFPDFLKWSSSNGETNQDWYLRY